MKPYFDNGTVQLYLGDCRDVLPTLPKASVHLIVTDPPYGVKWRSNWRMSGFESIPGDHDQDAALTALALALPLMRNNRHFYLFGRFDFAGLPVHGTTELIWDKGQMSGGDVLLWGKEHEYIQFGICRSGMTSMGNGAARSRRGSVLHYGRPFALRHPTEKPVPLLRELIEMSSRIGETVLDPFAGVGSTLVAAQLEGRKAIGIEIDERYCAIAAERLAQQVMVFGE